MYGTRTAFFWNLRNVILPYRYVKRRPTLYQNKLDLNYTVRHRCNVILFALTDDRVLRYTGKGRCPSPFPPERIDLFCFAITVIVADWLATGTCDDVISAGSRSSPRDAEVSMYCK